MANMTPESSESGPRSGERDDDKAPSALACAAEGAASVATKGARETRARFDQELARQRSQLSGRARTLGRALRGVGEMPEEDDLVTQVLHFASDKVPSRPSPPRVPRAGTPSANSRQEALQRCRPCSADERERSRAAETGFIGRAVMSQNRDLRRVELRCDWDAAP